MNTIRRPWKAYLTSSLFAIAPSFAQPPHQGDLRAWFKADAGVTVVADAVTQWTDQSANGFTFTPPDTGPSVISAAVNGRAAISFDGSTQLNGSLGAATLGNATIFALFRYTNESSDNDYLYTLGTLAASGSQMTLSRQSSDRAYHFDGATQNFSSNDTLPANQWFVSTQLFGPRDNNSHDLFLNAASVIRSEASNAYAADVTTCVIGNWTSGSFRVVGDVVELLVYDRALSETERADVEEYLRDRGGLAVFFKPEAEILSAWEIIQYELGAQLPAVWSFDLGGTRADQAINADPSILLSVIDVANKVIWGQFGSGSAPDSMGVVFGYQNRGEFYLLDWKKTTASFSTFGTAPQGMRLRVFHVDGDPVGRDFWAADAPAKVTVLRQNDLAWANGVDYDFSLRFTPGSFVIRIWEGDTVLETWEVEDATYLSGRFGYFINSLENVRFGQVFVNTMEPIRIVGVEAFGNQLLLRWLGGEPPFRIERNPDLVAPWTPTTGNIWDRIQFVPIDGDKQFYRVRSIGEELSNPP